MFAKALLSMSNFIWFLEASTATVVILILNYFILNILTLHKCFVNTEQIVDLLPAAFVCLLLFLEVSTASYRGCCARQSAIPVCVPLSLALPVSMGSKRKMDLL